MGATQSLPEHQTTPHLLPYANGRGASAAQDSARPVPQMRPPIAHTVLRTPRPSPATPSLRSVYSESITARAGSRRESLQPNASLDLVEFEDPNDPEFQLLGRSPARNENGIDPSASAHTIRTAPVLTGDAAKALSPDIMPQRAVYGRVLSQHVPGFARTSTLPKLYINSNAPFSALVCGVQGSGKSHTTSVLLESCLIRDERLGTLPAPLSGLVFHFDTASGSGHLQPSESAYLAALDSRKGGSAKPPDVVVLVLPGDLAKMRAVYAGLPGVRVEPLRFSSEDISGHRLLAMMKIDDSNHMPLYMQSIMAILRSMESFDYDAFRKELAAQAFNPDQKSALNLRLALLDSCLKGGNSNNRVGSHFKPGTLTIIDLSSQFMDGASACGFFELILGLFVEADLGAGKLVVLDEAHKYLSEDGSSSRLTDSLLTVIRQQRHLNTRIVISTQEPTVVPSSYLDLCSLIIAHRFSSPKWLRHLADHVCSADASQDALFSEIVSLQTGQAVMFAPAGLGVRAHTGRDRMGVVTPLGSGYLVVRSRERITRDGGHSLLAIQDPTHASRIGRGVSFVAVPTISTASQDPRTGRQVNDTVGLATEGQSSRRTSSASDTTRVDSPISAPLVGESRMSPQALVFKPTAPVTATKLPSPVSIPIAAPAAQSQPTKPTAPTVPKQSTPAVATSLSSTTQIQAPAKILSVPIQQLAVASIEPSRVATAATSGKALATTVASPSPRATSNSILAASTSATNNITAVNAPGVRPPPPAIPEAIAPPTPASALQTSAPRLPYPIPVLLTILEEQHAAGVEKILWSRLGELLKQRAPRGVWTFRTVIKDAEDRKLIVNSGSLPGGKEWVRKFRPLEDVEPRFKPLLLLFKAKGRTRLNKGMLGDLRRTSPGLISQGNGMVTAYIQEAVNASIISEQGDWVDLLLSDVVDV